MKMVPVQRNGNQQVMKLVRSGNSNSQNIPVMSGSVGRQQQVVRVVPTNKLGSNSSIISSSGHKVSGQKTIIVSKATPSVSSVVDPMVDSVCISPHSGSSYGVQTHSMMYGASSGVILNESGVSSQQPLNSKVVFVQPQNHLHNPSQQQLQLVSHTQETILHQQSSQQLQPQQQLLYSEVFFILFQRKF